MTLFIFFVVYIKTQHNTYLRASSPGIIRHSEKKDEKSQFKPIMNPDFSVYLYLFIILYLLSL